MAIAEWCTLSDQKREKTHALRSGKKNGGPEDRLEEVKAGLEDLHSPTLSIWCLFSHCLISL